MICNPQRGLPSRGCSKSWTQGLDSLVPSAMWWLIIFLPRLLYLFHQKPDFHVVLFVQSTHHGTAPYCNVMLLATPYCNVMLLATPWRHNILGAKWRCKNVVSHRRMGGWGWDNIFQKCKFWYRSVSSGRNNLSSVPVCWNRNCTICTLNLRPNPGKFLECKCWDLCLPEFCTYHRYLVITSFLFPFPP